MTIPRSRTNSRLEDRLLRVEEEIQVLRSRGLVSSPWITQQEVCESIGLSRWTVWRKVKSGDFPTPCQPFPNLNRWSLEEVERWKQEHLRSRRNAVIGYNRESNSGQGHPQQGRRPGGD